MFEISAILTILCVIVSVFLFFYLKETPKKKEEPQSTANTTQTRENKHVDEKKKQQPKTQDHSKHKEPDYLKVSLKGHSDEITSVSTSPDFSFVATTSKDGTLRLYRSTEFLHSMTTHKTYTGTIKINTENDYGLSSSFSSDNHHIVVGLLNWDILAYKIQEESSGEKDQKTKTKITLARKFNAKHSISLNSVLISPNSKLIVSCYDDTFLKLWSLKGTHLEDINSMVAISKDSRFLAVATWSAEVKVYEFHYRKDNNEYESISHAFSLSGHKSSVFHVSFSNDTTRMITVSKDGTWKLWQIDIRFHVGEEPHVLLTVQLQNSNNALPFKIGNANLKIELSPNKELVCLSTSSNLVLFNTSNGSIRGYIHNAHAGEITNFVWSPDGQYIITCAVSDTMAKVWTVESIPKI